MANKDLDRSQWEGMGTVSPRDLMSVGLKDFLGKIKAEFDSDKNMWGVRDAAKVIFEGMDEGQKNELLGVIKKEFAFKGELSVNEIPQFFEGEGGDILKDCLRSFLGEKEWDDFEKEGASRNLRHDQTFGGTPG